MTAGANDSRQQPDHKPDQPTPPTPPTDADGIPSLPQQAGLAASFDPDGLPSHPGTADQPTSFDPDGLPSHPGTADQPTSFDPDGLPVFPERDSAPPADAADAPPAPVPAADPLRSVDDYGLPPYPDPDAPRADLSESDEERSNAGCVLIPLGLAAFLLLCCGGVALLYALLGPGQQVAENLTPTPPFFFPSPGAQTATASTATPPSIPGGGLTPEPPYPYPSPIGSPPAQQTITPMGTLIPGGSTTPLPTFTPFPTNPPVVPTSYPPPPPVPTFAPPPTSPPPPPATVPIPTSVPVTPAVPTSGVTGVPTTSGTSVLPTFGPLPTRLPTFGPLPTPGGGGVPPIGGSDVEVISGNERWTPADSPIIVGRDLRVARGATLTIEPGVQVQIQPGVNISAVGGQILSLGAPGNPVRIEAAVRDVRWGGIYTSDNSLLVLEHTELSGGGAEATILVSSDGELRIRDSRIFENGGNIRVRDSRFEMRDTEITANDMVAGASITASYNRGNFVTMTGNRVGGNRLNEAAPGIEINNLSEFNGVVLDVQGNLFRGGIGNLRVTTNGPIEGTIACNALIGDGLGLGLRTETLQVPQPRLRIENNYIDEHTPAIQPTYLDFGIGRGATSEVTLDMRNNWWGESSGPYHPELNAEGRGNAVGVNIEFEPWLTSPPACVPPR